MPLVRPTYWDCHEHRSELRVSDFATVYHPEHGQLCIFEHRWDCFLAYPIQFTDRVAAHQWIANGTIAQLQESYSELGVGFTTNCLRNKDEDSG